ncbi:MAG: WbqC family protein [Bacteroidota bacterium]
MKLAIMQPYFFPYLGYFSSILNSDQFILLDDVQFIRHGWIERNRILKPNEGWQYLSVPLEKHAREILIKDIRIRKIEDWKGKIFRQLEHYRNLAPYYSEVLAFLNNVFNKEFDSIVKLNAQLLFESCNYLGIEFNYQIFSEMELEILPINGPGDWALNISIAMNASEYINPIGGASVKLNIL